MAKSTPQSTVSTPKEHRLYWEERYPNIPYGFCCCGCGESTTPAPMTSARRRKVKGCPQFYAARGHQNRLPFDRWRAEDRGFDTPCHIWLGVVDKKGYGFIHNRIKNGNQGAHRFFYERKYGELDGCLNLHHVCRVKDCVNPDHLQPLSPDEHARAHMITRVGGEKAEDIRYLYKTGRYTMVRLGEMYGVTHPTISDIIAGKRWVNT